jgi:Phage integrase family.
MNRSARARARDVSPFLLGLIWEAINFNRGYLIVSASIAKTGRKRKIDLPENPLKWLAPYRNRSGGAISDRDFGRPLARACEPARVKYKRNALRHSFGSYRMEMVKNAGQVALEMGNSAATVMKHYFDIVGHEQPRSTGTSDQFRALIERS